MRIEHIKKQSKSKNDFNLDEMSPVIDYIRTHYDPRSCTCVDISRKLAEMFDNLEEVQINMLVHDGEIVMKNHCVNRIKGTNYILDSTGDQFGSNNVIRLRHSVTPWIFEKAADGIYYSQNHMPVMPPNETYGPSFRDFDLVRLTASPLHEGLRCLIV